MIIEFTNEEAQQLLTLLDLAVKGAGLQAAQIALPLALKIQHAAQKSVEAAQEIA